MTSPEHSSDDEKLERLPLVPLSECPSELYVPEYDYVAEFARQRRPGFDERAFVEELGLDYDAMRAAFRRVRPEALPSIDELSEGFEKSKIAAERLTAFFSQGVSPEEAAENEAKYRAAMEALGFDPLKGKISFGLEAVSNELGKAAGPIGKLVEEEIKDLLSGADNPFLRDRRPELDPKKLKEISDAAAVKLKANGVDADALEASILANLGQSPHYPGVGGYSNPGIISALLGGLGKAIAEAWDEDPKDPKDSKDLKEGEGE